MSSFASLTEKKPLEYRRRVLRASELRGEGILLEEGVCGWDNIVKQIGIEKMRRYYEEE